MSSREGGCACGAVRFRLTSEPMSKKLWPSSSLERLRAVTAATSGR